MTRVVAITKSGYIFVSILREENQGDSQSAYAPFGEPSVNFGGGETSIRSARSLYGPILPNHYAMAVPSFTNSFNSFLFLIPLSGLLASVMILLQVDPDPPYNLEPTSTV